MRRRLIVVEQARGSQQHRALANRSDVFGLLALPDQKIEISVPRGFARQPRKHIRVAAGYPQDVIGPRIRESFLELRSKNPCGT